MEVGVSPGMDVGWEDMVDVYICRSLLIDCVESCDWILVMLGMDIKI